MLKTILKLLLGSVLIIAIQACAPMGQATLEIDFINTAIAQTLEAITLTSEPGIPATGEGSPTPAVTLAPPTPTESLSATPVVTSTPIFTFTPNVTPTVPQISVSVPTNCRVGPGRAYDRVGGLLVGEVAEVVGRNVGGNYWIIRNPDRQGQNCWLWGEYATVTGNTDALPIYTPPPTPTPSPGFEASFDGLERCEGTGWWVDIALENTGGLTFRSMALTVRNTVDNSVLVLYSDGFTNRNGCTETVTRDNLNPGITRIVSSPVFTYDPSGNRLNATITLCSSPGQSGTCITQTINFRP